LQCHHGLQLTTKAINICQSTNGRSELKISEANAGLLRQAGAKPANSHQPANEQSVC